MNSSYSIVPLPRIGDRRRPRLHLLFGVVRSVNRADGIIEEPCDRGSVRLFVVLIRFTYAAAIVAIILSFSRRRWSSYSSRTL
jgi:hypothetical protein